MDLQTVPPHHVRLANLCHRWFTRTLEALWSVDVEDVEATLYETHVEPDRRTTLVLVCLGPKDTMSWLRSFCFVPTPGAWDGRLWHRGFLRKARRLRHMFVAGLPYEMRPYWVTGHALGSAVAQIIGPTFEAQTVTFAPPRPLWLGPQPRDAHFVTNYAFTEDPLVHAGRIFGFRHVGRTVYMNRFGHSILNYISTLEEWSSPQ